MRLSPVEPCWPSRPPPPGSIYDRRTGLYLPLPRPLRPPSLPRPPNLPRPLRRPPLSLAIARVNVIYGAATGSASTLSTGSYTSTTGNLLVAATRGDGAALTSIADGTNTFTKITESAASDPRLSIWYAKNITGVTHTFDATWASNASYRWLYVIEYSGAHTTTPLDISGSNTGSGTTDLVSTAFTTTQTDEVIVLAGSQNALTTYTAGVDFTLIDGSIGTGGQFYGGIEEFITTTIKTTYTAHLTSGVTNPYATIWASFISAVQGGAATWGPLLGLANNRLVVPH